jgi:DNA repair protein RadA/Sms
MAKAKPAVLYACSECGHSSARWFGKCPGCGSFGTLEEERAADTQAVSSARPTLRLVEVEAIDAERIPTGVSELDRVLGGGLVPGSLVLVGGEPGVGVHALLAPRAPWPRPAGLLVTGEESPAQVRLRAERLGGGGNVEILAETELDAVCATLERERPAVCVIDSVQTLYSAELGSAPGSVAQVREAAARLLRVAKESGIAVFLVGHVTKDGAVAGPRVLEHLVDCVIQFEGDRYREHRVLRATKNRFGSTNEIGVSRWSAGACVGVPDLSAPSAAPSRARPARRRVHAGGNAADPARDPGARLPDGPRHAASRRHGARPEAPGDARRRAVAAREAPARAGRRLRQRRGRGSDRGARRGPCGVSRGRFGRARRASPGGSGRIRRGRAHRQAAVGGAG